MNIPSAGIFLFVCVLGISCDNSKKPTPQKIPESSPVVQPVKQHPRFDNVETLFRHYEIIHDSLEMIRSSWYKAGAGNDSLQKIDSTYFDMLQTRNEAIHQFMQTHTLNEQNLKGLLYLVVDKKFPIITIDSILDRFPSAVQQSELGKLIRSKIDERVKSEIRTRYDLALLSHPATDANNNRTSLSQIPGKYLLLDFWASWCGPCRFENRKLVKERNTLIPRNDVTIVAISLDKDMSRWLKALKEDGIDYPSICDGQALESFIYKGFGVLTVPYNVLIDKKGTILATNVWGEKLKAAITSLE